MSQIKYYEEGIPDIILEGFPEQELPRYFCTDCKRVTDSKDVMLSCSRPNCPWRAIDTKPPNPEQDPKGLNAHAPGAKLDKGKPKVRKGVLEYFPRAILAIAEVSEFGANKYAWFGWEAVEDGVERYGEADVRHILYAAIHGENDPESQKMHAAHEAWNALARLELILREKEHESRLQQS